MGKTIIMILAILFICLGTFVLFDPNVNLGPNRNPNQTTLVQNGNMACSISGEVEHPGNYILKRTPRFLISLKKQGVSRKKPMRKLIYFLVSLKMERVTILPLK